MREIEFRGKNAKTGEWLYGDLVHSANAIETDGIDLGSDVFIYPHESDGVMYSPDHFAVNPNTVGQYTGLTDANGTRIYEGDIVSFSTEDWYSGYSNWTKRVGKIVFVEDSCGFSILADDWYFSLTPKGIESEYLFVDGNVYDNFIPVEAEEDDDA